MEQTAALVRLQLRRLGERPGLRAARLYSIGIFASFALLVLLVRFDDAVDYTNLAVSALESASLMVAGLSAWACAADLSSEDDKEGVTALVGVHGVPPRKLEYSRLLGALVRTATAVAAPSFGIIVLGACFTGAVGWAVSLAAATLLYAALLAISLIVPARLVARWTKGWSKLVLLTAVLALEVLHAYNGAVPSWSSVFGAGLHELKALGKALA